MIQFPVEQVTQDKIRNFSIIAHIDHGKSTLADRILELANYDIAREKHKSQILDRLELEQEKGITIKLQACSLNWQGYRLNLIDTPGHVDFSYEVSRSLAACESAILLVDATQGIQAQTLSTAYKALELDLTLIPVINKVDMVNADVDARTEELVKVFGFQEDEILKVSAKTGLNVDKLLNRIIDVAPPPDSDPEAPLQALIFDSFYDEHKGVVIAIRIFQGTLTDTNSGELYLVGKDAEFTPTEIGHFTPNLTPGEELRAGDVGYIASGVKEIRHFTVGDTVSDRKDITPLPGYKRPRPNVFASFFPTDSDDYPQLRVGLRKLALNDASLEYSEQKSGLLGSGFRCGFLGMLHMEVIQERLEREYGLDLIIAAPTVEYKVKLTNGRTVMIKTPSELPDPSRINTIYEPIARVNIMTPDRYMGAIMDFCQQKRGRYVNTEYLQQTSSLSVQYITIEYDIPLMSLISDFFDRLKNLSSGYASMDYEITGFAPVDLIKVDILINKKVVPSLSFLEIKENARKRSVALLKRMKKVIPRQQIPVPLQAAINSSVIARETVSGYRKDVTAKLYGGDYSRRKKLLEKQKKGKKRLKQIGDVNIPQEVFLAILKT